MCCDAFKKMFHQDKDGGPSLAAVRVVSGVVKRNNYTVRPEVSRSNAPQHLLASLASVLTVPTPVSISANGPNTC